MRRFALLLAAWSLFLPAAYAQSERPNIVLIISDDQGAGDYSFLGHPHIKTPHIDHLTKESLLFTRAFVPTSLCGPSLASIITGRYPHQHLVTANDPPVVAGSPKDARGSSAEQTARWNAVPLEV